MSLLKLAEGAREALDLDGVGISVVVAGRLITLAVTGGSAAELEYAQEDFQQGPGVATHLSRQVVAVADLLGYKERWPDYCAVASEEGMRGVAAFPLRWQAQSIGALCLYRARSKEWSGEHLEIGSALANTTRSYLADGPTGAGQPRLGSNRCRPTGDGEQLVEQATDAIAREWDLPADEALVRLSEHARRHDASMAAVADAVLHLGLKL